MKPTRGWIQAITLIPVLVTILLCFAFGIIIWIVSLGHVEILKYGFAIGEAWGNLTREDSE